MAFSKEEMKGWMSKVEEAGSDQGALEEVVESMLAESKRKHATWVVDEWLPLMMEASTFEEHEAAVNQIMEKLSPLPVVKAFCKVLHLKQKALENSIIPSEYELMSSENTRLKGLVSQLEESLGGFSKSQENLSSILAEVNEAQADLQKIDMCNVTLQEASEPQLDNASQGSAFTKEGTVTATLFYTPVAAAKSPCNSPTRKDLVGANIIIMDRSPKDISASINSMEENVSSIPFASCGKKVAASSHKKKKGFLSRFVFKMNLWKTKKPLSVVVASGDAEDEGDIASRGADASLHDGLLEVEV